MVRRRFFYACPADTQAFQEAALAREGIPFFALGRGRPYGHRRLHTSGTEIWCEVFPFPRSDAVAVSVSGDLF
jgi:hypothetical protein